jgi:zinc transport system permease protein
VWRKMAYFADSMSHSSLLGIAIGLFFAIDFNVAVLMVALLFAGFFYLF